MKGETGHPSSSSAPVSSLAAHSFLFRPFARSSLASYYVSGPSPLFENRRESESLPSSSSSCPSSALRSRPVLQSAREARVLPVPIVSCMINGPGPPPSCRPLLCPPRTASYTGFFRGIRPSSRSLDSYAKHPSRIPPELEPISYLRATG